MVQITIDVPDELKQRAKMLNIELTSLIAKMLREKLKDFEEIERFKKIIAKSKATDKDVEELTDKVNTAMWEHHKKKYSFL